MHDEIFGSRRRRRDRNGDCEPREPLMATGLAAPQFEVSVSERDILIRLKDAARADAVRAALPGMPIRYRIQSAKI
jgi:hypothetical protein